MQFHEDLANPNAWFVLSFSEPEWDCIAAEYGTRYWARRATSWVKYSNGDNIRENFVMFEDVLEWLYSNVGFQYSDYWTVDRIYYREADLPDLRVDWDTIFVQTTAEQRNWRVHHNVKRIAFRKKDHAMMFKLAFHGIEDGPR